MTTAREEILGRIQQALADRPTPPPVPRDYRPGRGRGDVGRFAQRAAEYHATVYRADTGRDEVSVADYLAGVLAARPIERLMIADGFPDDWRPAIAVADSPVSVATLDEVGTVLTTCRLAIAETGTIVLDCGPGQGARVVSLVPDYHLVVVRADQIVSDVGDAIAELDPDRPQTWISGPSATSDIELDRVEGVHGPRTLDIVIVDSPAQQ